MQCYAFIDTNIFLDFYRSRTEATLSLLRKLDQVRDRIICTYQVEMEFLKNRQFEILKIARDQQLGIESRLPAVLADSQIDSALKKHKQDIEKRRKQLGKRVVNIVKNPALYDPIYTTLEGLFKSQSEHVLTREMPIRRTIRRLAWRRFMLGYPPRKDRDTSIGDSLNWEWFIYCAKRLRGKFIVVSRDSDFGSEYGGEYFLNDALKAEFRDRVGQKSITFTRKLSDALRALEVSVTSDELESEANLDAGIITTAKEGEPPDLLEIFKTLSRVLHEQNEKARRDRTEIGDEDS